MKKLVIYALFAVAVAVWSRAQEAPKPPESRTAVTLSAEEKFSIRSAQNETLRAGSALQASPAYQAFQQAQAAQGQLVQAIYDKHKVTADKFALCDGPAPGPCEKVGKGDIEFRPQKAEKEDKATK